MCHEASEMLLSIPPLAKDSQAVLLSALSSFSTSASHPAPLRASPPFSMQFSHQFLGPVIHSQTPLNEVAGNLPAIQFPLHVFCQGLGFSRACTVGLSLPNIPFAPNNPPENAERGSRGNDFPLVRNRLLGGSQRAGSALGFKSK